MKCKLKHEKTTKNTEVFKNNDAGAPISSLYIQKSAIKGDAPEEITVEIKEIK